MIEKEVHTFHVSQWMSLDACKHLDTISLGNRHSHHLPQSPVSLSLLVGFFHCCYGGGDGDGGGVVKILTKKNLPS